MRQPYFQFDQDRCVACGACAVACMDQNDIDTAHGQKPFRRVSITEQAGEDGRIQRTYLSRSCMHCEDAPCAATCPAGCIWKDPETGLTLYDSARCIGCRSCAQACPFDAPSFRPDGTMAKCDGCVARVRAGLLPACVKVCPFGALRIRTES